MTLPVLRRRQRNLNQWGAQAALTCMMIFLVTVLLLHSSLESANERSHLQQVGAVMVNGIRTNLQGRSNEQRRQSGTQRMAFEKDFPPTFMDRIQAVVETRRKPSPRTQPGMSYDIFNCPDSPVEGYPKAWSAHSILGDWNPDDTGVPTTIYQGICTFDWNVEEDRVKVKTYREAELPFVLRNHSDVLRVAERWNTPGYLQSLLGSTPQRTDHANSSNFMFSRVKKGVQSPSGWQPATDKVQMNYAEWLQQAQALETVPDQASREHWYFRVVATCSSNPGAAIKPLCDELAFFTPSQEPSLFIVEPDQFRGLGCRFGMRGVTSGVHYDGTRNWIALIGGQRRYILAHPDQCTNLELYPVGHPAARQGKQDWSRPELTDAFRAAQLNEVVLDAGDALYLPTAWFHFIVSLTTNYQCNARSGMTVENKHHIEECGFALQ